MERWFGEASGDEQDVLERVQGPVLDVGCGPGRYLVALARKGIPALGIDVAPSAVKFARDRGATVLDRSVFGRVPGSGRWGSALLLDGNIGIGGDPGALLARIRGLLKNGGRAFVEVEGPAIATKVLRAQLLSNDGATPWFQWARVSVADIARLSVSCNFSVIEVWQRQDRFFACLEAT